MTRISSSPASAALVITAAFAVSAAAAFSVRASTAHAAFSLALLEADRYAFSEGRDAIGFVADVPDLVAFGRGRALVVHEVAKLAERLTVRIRDQPRAACAAFSALIGDAGRDAARKLLGTSVGIADVARVVTITNGTRSRVFCVAETAERLALQGALTVGLPALL